MSKMEIVTLSGILAVARDDYKSRYNLLKAEFEKTKKAIKDNYKSGSQYYIEANEKAKNKFDSDVQALRESTRNFVKPNLEELRDDEIAEVRKIDSVAMEKLRAVSDLPLSAVELGILQQRFAPNNEYWAERMIATLAEKNGLSPMQYLHSATLDVKMDIMSQLEGQLEKLLAEYNGDVRYQTEVLLHDNVLLRAENIYTSGWKSGEMENIDVARRAFIQLKHKSPLEQGIGLSNIFHNASPEVQIAVFYEMLQDGEHTYDDAVKVAGLSEQYEVFKNKEYPAYCEARTAMRKTAVATSKDEVAKIANGLSDNKYYNKMLKSASEKNEHISSYLTEAGEE